MRKWRRGTGCRFGKMGMLERHLVGHVVEAVYGIKAVDILTPCEILKEAKFIYIYEASIVTSVS